MSQELISRNADLARLREEGYNIEIRATYLLVKDVPYVNAKREIRRGILVSKLNLAGDITQRPDDHQAQFAGEQPCHADGSVMAELGNGGVNTLIGKSLTVTLSFSQKPARGYYLDYHEKMAHYANMLSAQAQILDPEISLRVRRVKEPEPEDDTPFNYLDTASSRVDISAVAQKLALEQIAIVGGGGTGSYVLDLVAKTPMKKIHLFDGDVFSTHNAFRAPGAPSLEELRLQPHKADYLHGIYSKMRKGIVVHDYDVDAGNVHELADMKFVFLCLDKGPPKKMIVDFLESRGIPFIDVGMGLYLKNGKLGGILRITTSVDGQRNHVHEKARIPFGDASGNNEYDTNIQIADLNALNAALAVIKWKKLFGFYADSEKELFSAYTIDCNMLTSEDDDNLTSDDEKDEDETV
jgi:hypothetical protein